METLQIVQKLIQWLAINISPFTTQITYFETSNMTTKSHPETDIECVEYQSKIGEANNPR